MSAATGVAIEGAPRFTDDPLVDDANVDIGTASPIVKWAGGKGRLVQSLISRMPSSFSSYVEPFAGGLALYFALNDGTRPGVRSVVSDVNRDLMDAYRAVAADPDGVIRELRHHRASHSDDYYYRVRSTFNGNRGLAAGEQLSIEVMPVGSTSRAGAFIYLNKTCFNGLYRVNRSGKFNVPIGDYADPPICDEQKLRAASVALRGATLRSCDYRETIGTVGADALIYADPPYDGTFAAYSEGGFAEDDQRALAATLCAAVRRGSRVIASNADTPLIREIYSSMRIEVVTSSRSIGGRSAKRGAIDELIITGGY